MNEIERRRIRVRGVVQGVGYRYFTRTMAEQFHISGNVRNCSNGSVLVEAEGDPGSLDAFQSALRAGPRMAHVDDMEVEMIPVTGDRGFDMLSGSGS